MEWRPAWRFDALSKELEEERDTILDRIEYIYVRAARTHVRRSIGQQFRRAREQIGLARPAPPPNQEDA